MKINKLSKVWRLLKAWPLLIIFAMVSCVDVVQERIGQGGSNNYGFDEINEIPATLNIVADDSAFFLAQEANTIESVSGLTIGCESGTSTDFLNLEPTIETNGSATLSFRLTSGDINCFFAVSQINVAGTNYNVDTSLQSDSSLWASGETVDATNESGSGSAVIEVVNNTDDDDNSDQGYSIDTSITATFKIRTVVAGTAVSATFQQGGESGASSISVPVFTITASDDGVATDAFNLRRIRSEDEEKYYLLNIQLECPADLAGTTGTGILDYVKDCDGVALDATSDHNDADTSTIGSPNALEDFLWRFSLQNTATTSLSATIEDLHILSNTASNWDYLNEAEDGAGITDNPGYTTAGGADGCAATVDAATVNHKACIRDQAGAERGGFNLGLESTAFYLSDQAANPAMTLIVELTKISTASAARTTSGAGGSPATAHQDLAYFMIPLEIVLN